MLIVVWFVKRGKVQVIQCCGDCYIPKEGGGAS